MGPREPDQGDFDRLADAYCARCTVGFARHPPLVGSNNCFGSGVLVRYKKTMGILTCAHVAEAVAAESIISIIANGARDMERQSITIQPGDLRRVVQRGEGHEEHGPDLAFIELPPITMSSLEAYASTIDLQRQLAMNAHEPRGERFMEGLSGVPGEWVDEPDVNGPITELALTTMLVGGEISELPAIGDYDRILFTPGAVARPLRSYEGMSGGGAWFLGFRNAANGLAVEERRLVGIAFYQTAERQIVCHGRESIYSRLLPLIDALT